MPEKIVIKLDDGTEEEREYFTAEDLSAKENETKAQYEERIAEFEKSNKSENWKALEARAKIWEDKAKALESKGKTINDAGEVVDIKSEISFQDVEDRARIAARNEILQDRKEEFLSQYDEETRKVVEHNYNKLTAGEQITIGNMGTFINQAEMLSTPNNGNIIRRAVSSGRGIAPSKAEPVNFADTDSGKGLANEMGLKYANK